MSRLSRFIWQNGEADPNFQVAKMAIFYDFLSFQGPSSEKPKNIFLTQATPPNTSREHFATKTKAVLWNLWGKFLHTNKILFLKKQKNSWFLMCNDVISSHFLFSLKLYHCCKVQSFENLWWKSHHIWLRFEVIVEKTAALRPLFPYWIKYNRSDQKIMLVSHL